MVFCDQDFHPGLVRFVDLFLARYDVNEMIGNSGGNAFTGVKRLANKLMNTKFTWEQKPRHIEGYDHVVFVRDLPEKDVRDVIKYLGQTCGVWNLYEHYFIQ